MANMIIDFINDKEDPSQITITEDQKIKLIQLGENLGVKPYEINLQLSKETAQRAITVWSRIVFAGTPSPQSTTIQFPKAD